MAESSDAAAKRAELDRQIAEYRELNVPPHILQMMERNYERTCELEMQRIADANQIRDLQEENSQLQQAVTNLNGGDGSAPEVPERIPFLRDLSPEDLQKFVDMLHQEAAEHFSKWQEILGLFHGDSRRFVENVVLGLARNKVDIRQLPQTTFEWHINGDIQRGKSTCIMLIIFCVNFIDQYEKISDRCFSVVGSAMCPWVGDLKRKAMGLAQQELEVNDDCESDAEATEVGAPGGIYDDDTDDESIANSLANEIIWDDAEDVFNAQPVEFDEEDFQRSRIPLSAIKMLSGSKNDDLKREVFENGGAVFFARTIAQMNRLRGLINGYQMQQRDDGVVVSHHVVILDEADAMRGAGANSETAQVAQYERALQQLLGLWQCARGRHLRCPLSVDVSATNALPFFSMLNRLGGNYNTMPLDLQSFKATENYISYSGHFRRFQDRYLPFLQRSEEYMSDEVIDLYREVFTRDESGASREFGPCLMDCTAKSVNAGVRNNLQTHFAAAIDALQLKLEGEGKADSMLPFSIGIFIHGGHQTFPGKIGIRFVGPQAEHKLGVLFEDIALKIEKLRTQDIDEQRYMPQDGDYTPEQHAELANTICIESLRPLLFSADMKCQRENPEHISPFREIGDKKMDISFLNFLLYFLRCFRYPKVPIAIVGNGMIRRCLSLIAVDCGNSGPVKPVLCVTHLLIHAPDTTNVGEVVQQFLRPSTTLVQFYQNNAFPTVKVLAAKFLWDVVGAAVEFNKWITQDSTKTREQTVAPLLAIKNAVKENGAELKDVLCEHLQLPDSVAPMFDAKNPLGRRVEPSLLEYAKILMEEAYERRYGEQARVIIKSNQASLPKRIAMRDIRKWLIEDGNKGYTQGGVRKIIEDKHIVRNDACTQDDKCGKCTKCYLTYFGHAITPYARDGHNSIIARWGIARMRQNEHGEWHLDPDVSRNKTPPNRYENAAGQRRRPAATYFAVDNGGERVINVEMEHSPMQVDGQQNTPRTLARMNSQPMEGEDERGTRRRL